MQGITSGAPESAPRAQDDFTRALTKLREHLLRSAVRWTRETVGAEDLVQDTLRRALEARASFRNGTSLMAWTRSIMKHLFIDGCRKRKALVPLRDENEADADDDAPAELAPLDVLSMDDVHTAMQELNSRDREIFTLCCLRRHSYSQVARALGIAEATVGTRLFRVRAKLRRRLQALCDRRLLRADASPPPLPLQNPALAPPSTCDVRCAG
jgi:RNA polymerase sigma-70 factor, ECF subfamily